MEHLVVVNPMFIEDGGCWWLQGVKKVILISKFCKQRKMASITNWTGFSAQLRRKMDLAEDQFVVIGAGQVQKRKGIDDFIRLYAGGMPETLFIQAGGFSFGGMTDGYERYKEDNGQSTQKILFSLELCHRNGCGILYATGSMLPSYNELFLWLSLEAASREAPIMLWDLICIRLFLMGIIVLQVMFPRWEKQEWAQEWPWSLKGLERKSSARSPKSTWGAFCWKSG